MIDLKGVFGKDAVKHFIDSVHFNDDGHRILAKSILSYVEEMLSELPEPQKQ